VPAASRRETIESPSPAGQPRRAHRSRIPEDSVLFERIVPVVLSCMGAVTIGLILFAAAVLLGLIHF
jgi:hypothetical protein